MKKVFSIIAALMFFSGAVVFAFNVQDDSPCLEPNHIGYTYLQGETPPPTSNPNDLPENMTEIGQFERDFTCDETSNLCHWAYDYNEAQWVPCNTGNLVTNP